MFSAFSTKGNRGFSLTELMCVVGITGILATMVQSSFLTFRIRAQRAELRTNLPHAQSLINSYLIDWGQPIFRDYPLAVPTDPTQNVCDSNNPFGFQIENCRGLHYYYQFFQMSPGGPANWGWNIFGGNSYNFACANGRRSLDSFVMTGCGEWCVARDVIAQTCDAPPVFQLDAACLQFLDRCD